MHDVEQIERELKEAVEGMSVEAREAWEQIEQIEKRDEYMDRARAVLMETDPSAWDDLRKALVLKAQLMGAQAQEAAGKQALAKQILAAMNKARELEPSLPEKGLTVGERCVYADFMRPVGEHSRDPGEQTNATVRLIVQEEAAETIMQMAQRTPS